MAKNGWRPDLGVDRGSDSTGGRGYDRVAAAQLDHDAIVADLGRIRDELAQTTDSMAGTEQEHAQTVVLLSTRLERMVGALMEQGPDQDPGTGAAAMQTTEMLADEVQAAESANPRSMWVRVLDMIKSVSKHLWSMISHLLKIKEWTVSGDGGLSLLGLAKVGISVTFG